MNYGICFPLVYLPKYLHLLDQGVRCAMKRFLPHLVFYTPQPNFENGSMTLITGVYKCVIICDINTVVNIKLSFYCSACTIFTYTFAPHLINSKYNTIMGVMLWWRNLGMHGHPCANFCQRKVTLALKRMINYKFSA